MLRCGLAIFFDADLPTSLFQATTQRIARMAVSFRCLCQTPRLLISDCPRRLRLACRELPGSEGHLATSPMSWGSTVEGLSQLGEVLQGTSVWLVAASTCLRFDERHMHQVLIDLQKFSRVWVTMPVELTLAAARGFPVQAVVPSLAGVRFDDHALLPIRYMSLDTDVSCGSTERRVR